MDRCYILLSLILHDLLSFSQSFRFLTGYVAVKSLYCPYTISTFAFFGKAATSNAARAGNGSAKNSA